MGSKDTPSRKDKNTTATIPFVKTHGKLYVFADMFNNLLLREHSANTIITLMPFFVKLEDRANELVIIALLDYRLYSILVTTGTQGRLVKLVARYAGFLNEGVGGYPRIHTVLATSVWTDVFIVFCR